MKKEGDMSGGTARTAVEGTLVGSGSHTSRDMKSDVKSVPVATGANVTKGASTGDGPEVVMCFGSTATDETSYEDVGRMWCIDYSGGPEGGTINGTLATANVVTKLTLIPHKLSEMVDTEIKERLKVSAECLDMIVSIVRLTAP